MKKNLLVLGAALTLLLTLSACGRQTVIRTTDTLDQVEPGASAAEPLPAEPAAGEEETAWSLDPRRCYGRFCRRYAHPPAGTCAERTRLHV